MNSEVFCSLLPQGSAVTYITPGRVWIAFSGDSPGRIFCISEPLSCTAERVVDRLVTSTCSTALAGSAGSAAGAVAIAAGVSAAWATDAMASTPSALAANKAWRAEMMVMEPPPTSAPTGV